jgi:homocysteine S-methyltransferase
MRAWSAVGAARRGDYGVSEEELMAFHRPRLSALLEASPDLLAFETIPLASEAKVNADATVRAMRRMCPNVSEWVRMCPNVSECVRMCPGDRSTAG